MKKLLFMWSDRVEILDKINRFVWGIPVLLMIIGVGILLSFMTDFVQVRWFPKAIKAFGKSLLSRGNTQYKSLCTALAATVGTGNIVGVAGAIVLGGPGAVFWMWVCAWLGMATKFAEVTLAVRYRTKNDAGEYLGGPMYMIRDGLGNRRLAACYCGLGLVASFGVGNATQVNAFLSGVHTLLSGVGIARTDLGNFLIGISVALLVALVLLGGAKRIGDVAQQLVPIAAIVYILLCVLAICLNYERVPGAIRSILQGAFSPKAATGGLIGSAFCALRVGASRGTFTNEAGMGTASIAHANAEVTHPVEQGVMGIVEVFLDTVCICTLTALVILSSNIEIRYGGVEDGLLTMAAFADSLGSWTKIPLAMSICCFGFATVIGWSLYGGRCAQYLFGDGSWKWYVFVQATVTVISSVLKTETLWVASEILNGLMAVPNLVALIFLSPELIRLIKSYSGGKNLTKGILGW